MALAHDTTNSAWTGLAADTKPVTLAHIGETFYESDTGKTYAFTGKGTGGWSLIGYVPTAPVAVAALPAAAAALQGARAFVTDANAATFLTTVAAGGANKVPVVCDGTVWKIG